MISFANVFIAFAANELSFIVSRVFLAAHVTTTALFLCWRRFRVMVLILHLSRDGAKCGILVRNNMYSFAKDILRSCMNMCRRRVECSLLQDGSISSNKIKEFRTEISKMLAKMTIGHRDVLRLQLQLLIISLTVLTPPK